MLAKPVAIAAALAVLLGTAAAQAADLNDAEIAHIAYTAGEIDIEAAELALQKSASQDVRGFAETMLRDHTAVNEQALALLARLGVTPQDNDTSMALSKQAAANRAALADLSDSAFDKAYIEGEVAYHKTVNEALETLLIPSADNAELKDLLSAGLQIFQGHGQHAEQLSSMVE